MALVLVALCVVCLIGELKVRGRARYARVGAGTRRIAAPRRWVGPDGRRLLAFAALIVGDAGRAVGHGRLLAVATCSAATSPVAPSLPLLLAATLASVGYGLAGAAAAVVLAAPLGYLATRYPSRWSVLLERIAYLAQGVPGIVVALAFISLTVQTVRPLYQSAALLVFAYAILFLPFALVSVRAALAQVPRGLEEAGRSLGLGWFAVTRRVLAPLAGPGVGAGAAMVFVFVATELTATLLLAPIGTRTLATEVWANTTSLAFAAAAPFAAMMLAISLLSTWLLAHRFGAAAFRCGSDDGRCAHFRGDQGVRRNADPARRRSCRAVGRAGRDLGRVGQRQDDVAEIAGRFRARRFRRRSRSTGGWYPVRASTFLRSDGGSATSPRRGRCFPICRSATTSCSGFRAPNVATASKPRRSWKASACPRPTRAARRTNFRAASNNVSRWLARSRRRPKLVLLDEPFSALDAALRIETRQAVAAIAGRRLEQPRCW